MTFTKSHKDNPKLPISLAVFSFHEDFVDGWENSLVVFSFHGVLVVISKITQNFPKNIEDLVLRRMADIVKFILIHHQRLIVLGKF